MRLDKYRNCRTNKTLKVCCSCIQSRECHKCKGLCVLSDECLYQIENHPKKYKDFLDKKYFRKIVNTIEVLSPKEDTTSQKALRKLENRTFYKEDQNLMTKKKEGTVVVQNSDSKPKNPPKTHLSRSLKKKERELEKLEKSEEGNYESIICQAYKAEDTSKYNVKKLDKHLCDSSDDEHEMISKQIYEEDYDLQNSKSIKPFVKLFNGAEIYHNTLKQSNSFHKNRHSRLTRKKYYLQGNKINAQYNHRPTVEDEKAWRKGKWTAQDELHLQIRDIVMIDNPILEVTNYYNNHSFSMVQWNIC